MEPTTGRLCLVTGATGYIGGRLVPGAAGSRAPVRVLARHPDRLRDLPWHDDVEVAVGDAADREALARAMADVEVAYYLIHAIGTGPDFERTEEAVARTFATVARESGVQRIVYLGGLAHDENLSEHLRSRAEVGEILLASGVPDRRAGSRHRHRLRIAVLRDAALPHRAAAR